jgi:hypothetical protein
VLRLGKVFHQPEQAHARGRHGPAERRVIEPVQLGNQGRPVEVELLGQGIALASQTIRQDPLHRRPEYHAPDHTGPASDTVWGTTQREPNRTRSPAFHVSWQAGQVAGDGLQRPRAACGGPPECWLRPRQQPGSGPGLQVLVGQVAGPARRRVGR